MVAAGAAGLAQDTAASVRFVDWLDATDRQQFLRARQSNAGETDAGLPRFCGGVISRPSNPSLGIAMHVDNRRLYGLLIFGWPSDTCRPSRLTAVCEGGENSGKKYSSQFSIKAQIMSHRVWTVIVIPRTK